MSTRRARRHKRQEGEREGHLLAAIGRASTVEILEAVPNAGTEDDSRALAIGVCTQGQSVYVCPSSCPILGAGWERRQARRCAETR